jgi:hypothetical protein
MHSATVSMLLPTGKTVQYYESFLLQYSLVVSSNLIIFELVSNSTEDQILSLFEKYHGQIDDHKEKNMLLTAMMIESNAPQANEIRGLSLDKFFLSMAIDEKSPKFILSSFINAKEFLLIYAVFEGVVKAELVKSGILNDGKFLREKDIVNNIALRLAEKKGLFEEHLSARSPFGKIEDVDCFWDFFTHFRHLFIHSGGYATQKWLDQLTQKKKNIINTIKSFECQMSAKLLIDSIEELELFNGKMFYIGDRFLNIFRNLIVLIMESMYLVEEV